MTGRKREAVIAAAAGHTKPRLSVHLRRIIIITIIIMIRNSPFIKDQ